MPAFRFDCVFHYVTDMDRAVSFYRDVLGFDLKSRDVVARFDAGGVTFEVAPAPDEDALRGGGNARLCLGVDDIPATLEELRERGVRIGPVREVQGGTLATFHDPDGNEVYLWQSRRRG